MTTKIVKRMDIKEFRENGYLQEVNRRFFHPLGLALEVTIDEDEGTETITGVWDYRDEDGGIIFDLKKAKQTRVKTFKDRFLKVENAIIKANKKRLEKFGWEIEPIPED